MIYLETFHAIRPNEIHAAYIPNLLDVDHKQEFEDTKRVSRRYKSKNGQANTMVKRKGTERIYKTLHRKLKIGTCDGVYIVGSRTSSKSNDKNIHRNTYNICLRHFYTAVEIVG